MNKPVLTPLLELLHSRKFMLALIFMVLALAVRFIPNLSPYEVEVITNILLVGLAAPFLHLSAEDIIKTWKAEEPASLHDALQEIVTEIVGQLVPVLVSTGQSSGSVVQSTVEAVTPVENKISVSDAALSPLKVTLTQDAIDAIANAVRSLPPAL